MRVIRSFKIIAFSVYLHLAMIFRQKETMFFAVFFPIFLFVLFGKIWEGDDDGYVIFLLSGIIGMTVSSDSLFGIGPLIKEYRQNNILKFFKTLPFNVNLHFLGLFIHTMILILLTIFFLSIVSIVFFDHYPSINETKFYILGIILGTLVFSFMSLLISFLWKNPSGFINFIYFLMLFIGGTFYPIEEGTFIYKLAQFFPLTHLLILMRGDISAIWILLLWLLLFATLFAIAFRKKSLMR